MSFPKQIVSLPWYDPTYFVFRSSSTLVQRTPFGLVVLALFGIVVTLALTFKFTMGAKSKGDLKKNNIYDEIFNNWIQTVLMFVGLDIGGAVSSYLTSGTIDFWNIAVSGSCRNMAFLIFNILKFYFIQSGPLAV